MIITCSWCYFLLPTYLVRVYLPVDPSACSEDEMRCDIGLCIEPSWLCDGDDDCGNGWDERPENCHPRSTTSESTWTFVALPLTHLLSSSFRRAAPGCNKRSFRCRGELVVHYPPGVSVHSGFLDTVIYGNNTTDARNITYRRFALNEFNIHLNPIIAWQTLRHPNARIRIVDEDTAHSKTMLVPSDVFKLLSIEFSRFRVTSQSSMTKKGAGSPW